MSLGAGEVFAGYTVVRLLGSGGLGELYLAKHPALPRQDAIRVLPAWISADAEFRTRFERDVDLAATLWHPHLVGVYGRGECEGRLWIATEFVEGDDAGRLMRDRYPNGMPAEEVVDVVTAIADALDYAHGRHLLHGDVHPGRILLTAAPARRILLTDFGIPCDSGGPVTHTATTVAMGAAAYTAPEQLAGGTVDGRADQYALAATASHLLNGAPQFGPALGRALATDPSARFDTCLGFAAALRDGLAGTANTVVSPIPRIEDSPVRFDGPETGPGQPAFVPAWSEEPAPNPYPEDPYPEDPYPDPDPSHSPTMAAMPAAAPAAPESDVEHPSGPTGRIWAMAGVASVVALVVVLVVFVARGGSETTAEPSAGPPSSSSVQPPAPPMTAATTAANGRAAPPPVAGPDGVGETCLDGYQITGRAAWASHGVRGNAAATCAFVGNVLKAYWDAADPDDAPRTVVAAGAIPCADGAQCSGDGFVVTCGVEGSDPWVTCRGGRGAVVVLY